MRMHSASICFVAVFILLVVAIRFAEPVRDGDLWWQMAYGRYLIENQTLSVDNSAFSWGPTRAGFIYCAWIPEILLYLTYSKWGLTPLFALRYFCLLVFLALFVQHAHRNGVLRHPLTWLVAMLGVLMSQTAAFIKPEILSYLFMVLLVWNWWSIKLSGGTAWRRCYLFPLIMLIWANSHGGFIFGLAFLTTLCGGDLLNRFFPTSDRLEPEIRRHFWVSLAACCLVVFITPYGWQYPLQLLRDIGLGNIRTEQLNNIFDYITIFDVHAGSLHFLDYLLLASGILMLLVWPELRRRHVDWTIILTNMVFAFLFVRFLRTTHYWVPVFTFSSIYLLSRQAKDSSKKSAPNLEWMQYAAVVLLLLLGGRAMYDAQCRPFSLKWCGFGISYQNPVIEADYIQKHISSERIGNDFNAAGYLIWALWPRTKVFYGPQFYPSDGWYGDYSRFLEGKDMREFMARFPCDVWVISYSYSQALAGFQRFPDWRLAYYGPVAAVYVRKQLDAGQAPKPVEALKNIRNLDQALSVLAFSLTIPDLPSAEWIVQGINERFWCPNERSKVAAAQNLYSGVAAFLGGDYLVAGSHLELCEILGVVTYRAMLVDSYLHLAGNAYQIKDLPTALNYSRSALKLDPENLYALFNVGSLEYYLWKDRENRAHSTAKQAPAGVLTGEEFPGREPMRKFYAKARAATALPPQIMTIAGGIVAGEYAGDPLVLVPPEEKYRGTTHR